MTTRREMMFKKYRTSSIFDNNCKYDIYGGKENESGNCINKQKGKDFIPKYENITAKERYLKHFHTNTTPLTKKIQINNNNKTCTSIKTNQPNNKVTSLQAHDIMCRDMYNGCDTKLYKLRRSKSTYIERSYKTEANTPNQNARSRCIEYNRSNIFFVNNTPSFKTEPSKPLSRNKNNNNHQHQKSFTFKRSLFATNTDWKSSNTEVPSFKRSKSLHANTFKKSVFYKETHSSNLKEKTKAIPSNSKTHFNNIESVSYNIISGEEIKEKKHINGNTKFISETYVIDVPYNFNKTDVNTIKNYFVKEKIHIYGIDEKMDHIGNNKGKIKFKIRRDVGDKGFQGKLNSINVIINEKKMKMKKEEESKVKQRQKTPGVRWELGKQNKKKNGKK